MRRASGSPHAPCALSLIVPAQYNGASGFTEVHAVSLRASESSRLPPAAGWPLALAASHRLARVHHPDAAAAGKLQVPQVLLADRNPTGAELPGHV